MKDKLFKIFGGLILISSFVFAWLVMDIRLFLETPLTVDTKQAEYIIAPGASMTFIAHDLAKKGLIDKPRYLVWLARFKGIANEIQAGEYRVHNQMTPAQLLEEMVSGNVIQYTLTIIEGRTFREIMSDINNHTKLKHTLTGFSDDEIMAVLGHIGQHPEGRFFPETYHFTRDTSDVELLRRAHQMMSDRLATEWEFRSDNLPLKSPYEALILASIIEKETGVESEREMIAGVMIRRLQKRMRLQVDPTVIYGLGEGFDGNLRRQHLTQNSPYNTYRNYGLPPTPIATPGGEAIHAALHPAPGDTLYYVSKGDGSHYFSSTLKEHNNAVIKYQLHGKPRAFSSSNLSSRQSTGQ